jgi:DNA invertase Pin-like site-specific DNA recombinase
MNATFRRVPIKDIDSGQRHRVDMGDIAALANSLRDRGQIQPVVVMEAGAGKYTLLAGARRLAAALELGWADLEAKVLPQGSADVVEALLVERDENTCRKDFTPSEAPPVATIAARPGATTRQAVPEHATLRRRVAMSVNHSTNGQPVPACVYYRRSTLKQEDSIERQRSQVVPYADKHGYAIVKEYVDEGISGSEETKRKAFMAMLKDAAKGQFKAILVDDADRFARFDSITYGYYVKPLRDAGVFLVTVAQGTIDWNSFAGRITSAALSESKNTEQAALSRRVLSQMLLLAKQGKHLGGKPLYGLRLVREAVEVPGKGVRLVPVRYEPDGLKAEAVKLIFRLYDEGRTLAQIRVALHDRGIPSPGGKEWWGRHTILAKLTHPKYTGAMSWGHKASGKRYRQRNGEMHERTPGEKQNARNRTEDCVVVPDQHEPLVSQEMFARVQARLRGGRKVKGKEPGSGGQFTLSKILVLRALPLFHVRHHGPRKEEVPMHGPSQLRQGLLSQKHSE